MDIDRALVYETFLHFYHLDHSNAAVHTAEVRFSPITFRLAEALHGNGFIRPTANIAEVIADSGKYKEDKGR
jgi:hypothetical protein